ncbi:MAG TPA: type I phosphomannose isomerase catalytic subunit [Terriglobales bacterium]|nr:type I phosphomannose isomerase catalytic subunit [Terriglobales bacterium]
MSDLYPLLMSPIFDPRPWGTLDLSPIYPNHRPTEKIGESWLTGDHCKVANGPLRGKSLAQLSAEYGRKFVGEAARDATRFPLLAKFLFPHEKLSVQVHPDDEAARQIGEPHGKTECWYVAHAQPGAQIALGLKAGVTKANFEKAIHEKQAENLLNWIDVSSGEMIYVVGGTVHTLGPGAIIVETQQQSDTTYRLYDYGRPRELHLRAGLSVLKEQVRSGKVVRPAPHAMEGMKNRCSPLVVSPYFVVELFELKEVHEFRVGDKVTLSSVQILVCVDGCGVLEADGVEPTTFAKGDAVVVPASTSEFRIRPQWSVEVLKSSLPGRDVPEPVTTL